jgi:hypothetical protein
MIVGSLGLGLRIEGVVLVEFGGLLVALGFMELMDGAGFA